MAHRHAEVLVKLLKETVGGKWEYMLKETYPHYVAFLDDVIVEETISVSGVRHYDASIKFSKMNEYCMSASMWAHAQAYSFKKDVEWTLYTTPKEAVVEVMKIAQKLLATANARMAIMKGVFALGE